MKPCDCKNTDEVCELNNDNHTIGDFWIMTDGYHISFCEQKNGEPPRQSISIPRKTFEKMMNWWNKEQKKP